MSTHRVGDRVCRRKDVFDAKSALVYGHVSRRATYQGEPVYYVRWDDGTESGGFFAHGLTPAAINEGRKEPR